jgi:DNA modification methylase
VNGPACRLMLGDCLDRMAEVEAGSVDAVICDLPYGSTACRWDQVIPLGPLWAHYRRVLKPAGTVILTAIQPFASMLVTSNPGWFRYEWVWDRGKKTSGHLDAKRRPLRKHELILVFGPRMPAYRPIMTSARLHRTGTGAAGGAAEVFGRVRPGKIPYHSAERYPVDILSIPADNVRRRVHPTQKPVALGSYLIRTYTDPGETVLDNAFGSGSFGVAAVLEGRSFIGIEKDPAYFVAAEKRIAEARTAMPLFANSEAR